MKLYDWYFESDFCYLLKMKFETREANDASYSLDIIVHPVKVKQVSQIEVILFFLVLEYMHIRVHKVVLTDKSHLFSKTMVSIFQ